MSTDQNNLELMERWLSEDPQLECKVDISGADTVTFTIKPNDSVLVNPAWETADVVVLNTNSNTKVTILGISAHNARALLNSTEDYRKEEEVSIGEVFGKRTVMFERTNNTELLLFINKENTECNFKLYWHSLFRKNQTIFRKNVVILIKKRIPTKIRTWN